MTCVLWKTATGNRQPRGVLAGGMAHGGHPPHLFSAGRSTLRAIWHPGEITYSPERIAMYLQNKDSIYDLVRQRSPWQRGYLWRCVSSNEVK